MAEAVAAVGLAASVVSIVDFAIKSFKAVKDYLSDAEKAPKWIQDAHANTSYVLSLLERIKTLDEGKFPPNAVASIAEECKAKAESLDGILKGLKLPPKSGSSNKAKVFFLSVSLALKSERERGKLEEMSRILGQVKDILHLELSRLNVELGHLSVELGHLNLEKQGRAIAVAEDIQDRTIELATNWTETSRRLEDKLNSLVMFHKSQAPPGGLYLNLTKHQNTIQTSRGHTERLLTDREIEQAGIRRMQKSHCPPSCPCKCHNMERQSADPRVGVVWRIALFASTVAIPCSYSACKYRQGNLDIRIPSNRLFNPKLIQIAFKIGNWSISPLLSFQPLIEGDPMASPACRILHDIRSPGTMFPKAGWTAEITIRQLQKAFDDRRSSPIERFPIYKSVGDPGSRYLGSENLLSVASYILYPADPEEVASEEIVKLMTFLIQQGCTMDTSPNLIGENCMFKWFYDVPEKLQDYKRVITLLHDAGWEIGRLDQNIDPDDAYNLGRSLLNSNFMGLLCESSHHYDGILGNSELFGAILRNDVPTAKRLLGKGSVNIDETVSFSGDTALHLAVMVESTGVYRTTDITDELLKWTPDIDAKNNKGLRILDLCARYSLLDTTIKLLEAGGSPVDNRPSRTIGPSVGVGISLLGCSTSASPPGDHKDFVRAVTSWCSKNGKQARIQKQLDQWLRLWIEANDLEWCRVYLEAGANADLRDFFWDFSSFKECADLIKEFGGRLKQDTGAQDINRTVKAVLRGDGSLDSSDDIIRKICSLARDGDMAKCLFYLDACTPTTSMGRGDDLREAAGLIRDRGGLLQYSDPDQRNKLQYNFDTALRYCILYRRTAWCGLLMAAGASGDLSDFDWDFSCSEDILAIILEYGGRIKQPLTRTDKIAAVRALGSISYLKDPSQLYHKKLQYWRDQGDTEWSELYEEVLVEAIEDRDSSKFYDISLEIEKGDEDLWQAYRKAYLSGKLRILFDWCLKRDTFSKIRDRVLSRTIYWARMALRFKENDRFVSRFGFYLDYCVLHIWKKGSTFVVPSEVLTLLKERGNHVQRSSETVTEFVLDCMYDASGDEDSEDDGIDETDEGERTEEEENMEDTEDEDVDDFFDC